MNLPFISHKKKCTAGAVLLTSILLFGFDGTWDRFSLALNEARGKADEIMPTDTLLSLARRQISAAEERLLDAEAAAHSHLAEQNRTRDSISRLQSAAAQARSRLETLRPALASTNGFQHCGANHSQAEVREDALKLALFVKQCESELTVRQSQLQELAAVSGAGSTELQDARASFQQAKSRVTALEIRLTQQQAVADATQAARAARAGVDAGLEGDLSRTLSVLDKRLSRLQRQNESQRADGGGVPSGNIRFDTSDPESLVDDVLGRKPAVATN